MRLVDRSVEKAALDAPRPTPPTLSTTPTGRSTARSWPYWTPSTPAPTPTSSPRPGVRAPP